MIFKIALAVAIVLIVAAAVFFVRWFKPKPLKTDYFLEKWSQLQGLLRDKTKWAEAVTEADKLLDEALKKRHFRGRTMGSRLVRAQRLLSDNDGVWFGHKLRNKIDADTEFKLKEADVKQALMGIRQALKDLGALPDAKQQAAAGDAS